MATTLPKLNRDYLPTKEKAEQVLKDQKYSYDPRNTYPWTSPSGLVSAEIRYNSQGYWINYCA